MAVIGIIACTIVSVWCYINKAGGKCFRARRPRIPSVVSNLPPADIPTVDTVGCDE